MKVLDLETWNRKQLFNHFNALADPYFGVVIPFDVTKAYKKAKKENISFFAKYLHDCMRAINEIDNLKLRIVEGNVVQYNVINASATLMRKDKTFGFSFIKFNESIEVFIKNIESEKNRIENSSNLYPPTNSLDCIHCSAMPWVNFVGHKEPVSGNKESVPKFAFSKMTQNGDKLMMNVSIDVNHALVDGYHIGIFSDKFQSYLDA
ncbi:chloramphenicol acetyltransferase [Postechiella marina]|uniref:Chloramphenicol acetyltransferase n=1 Tax=Postechiella marina TaxID=943941 RepID=A0ABP8C141_9FLAO